MTSFPFTAVVCARKSCRGKGITQIGETSVQLDGPQQAGQLRTPCGRRSLVGSDKLAAEGAKKSAQPHASTEASTSFDSRLCRCFVDKNMVTHFGVGTISLGGSYIGGK